MPQYKIADLDRELVEKEYSSAVGSTVRGEEIGVAIFTCPAGAEIKPHARRNEQIQSIMKGTAKYRVGGEEKLVVPGDAVLIRADTEYSAKIQEDLEVIGFEDVRAGKTEKQGEVKSTAFFRWTERESDWITPKYSKGRGPTIKGERIMVMLMNYPAGPEQKPHRHPNEQIQVALKGRTRGVLGGKPYTMGPGDINVKPANMEHWGQILEEYTNLTCKDIVPGWSIYHAQWEKW